MQTQVKLRGGCLGIRLPKETLQETDFFVEGVFDDKATDGMITLSIPFRHKTIEERASEYDGKLDLDGEFDWRESLGNEIW